MGKKVMITVAYGIQGENMIRHAEELIHPDDEITILVLDFNKDEFKYNKDVDFRLFEKEAEKIEAKLEIVKSLPKTTLESTVKYARKYNIEHLIMGEDREQILDLILAGSLSHYILSRLPNTYLTMIPFAKSVDNDYFDYSSGERVYIKQKDDGYFIMEKFDENFDYEGVYYKSNYTDFDTGVVYIYHDDKLLEKRVIDGKIENIER